MCKKNRIAIVWHFLAFQAYSWWTFILYFSIWTAKERFLGQLLWCWCEVKKGTEFDRCNIYECWSRWWGIRRWWWFQIRLWIIVGRFNVTVNLCEQSIPEKSPTQHTKFFPTKKTNFISFFLINNILKQTNAHTLIETVCHFNFHWQIKCQISFHFIKSMNLFAHWSSFHFALEKMQSNIFLIFNKSTE